MKQYLTVKEFAAAANVSQQYIYKIQKTTLKDYTKRINKKLMIHQEALKLFLENSTEVETVEQPNSTPANKEIQPEVETVEQPNSTTNSTAAAGEIESLKLLIAELQQDKADLKKDKEHLQQQLEVQQQLITNLGGSLDKMQILLNQQQQLSMIDKAGEPKKKKLIDRIFNR